MEESLFAQGLRAVTHGSKEVSFRGFPLSASQVERLCTALRQGAAQLRVLDLRECELGCDGATKLAESLVGNGTLRELLLSRNSIGNRGADALSKFLSSDDALDSLDLDGASCAVV